MTRENIEHSNLLAKAEVISRSDDHIVYKTDRGEITIAGTPQTLLETIIYQDGSRERIKINEDEVVSVRFASVSKQDEDHEKFDVDYMREFEAQPEDAISRTEALAAGRPQMAGFTHNDVLEAYEK